MLLLQRESGFKMPAARRGVRRSSAGSAGATSSRRPRRRRRRCPSWRRLLEGFRHSKGRDAEAIHHHYDVSNRFYEMVLGPSMTYTCAVLPDRGRHPRGGAVREVRPGLPASSACSPGMRLLDVGCGWGGMVRHAAKHYGVEVVGVTLSREQAAWAQEAIKREGLDDVAEVRFGDYRDVPRHRLRRGQLDRPDRAHRRSATTRRTSRFLRDKLRPGRPAAQPLHHPARQHASTDTGAFIDRYVFPDGELTGSGRIITEMQNVGLEVRHEENLREHYALTLKGWCENLGGQLGRVRRARSARAPRRCGASTWPARGCRFERNEIQLHQVLAVKPDAGRRRALPAAPDLARLTSAAASVGRAVRLPVSQVMQENWHSPWEVPHGECQFLDIASGNFAGGTPRTRPVAVRDRRDAGAGGG